MRALTRLTISIAIIFVMATLTLAQQISISITDITANQRICGTVSGLSPQDYPNYKIIIYVHTDQWYVHPYAGQDEGKSWAAIQQDGKWQIQTVQREFKADKIAALLVKRNYPEPSKVESLERIQKNAVLVKELRDTPDYGKL